MTLTKTKENDCWNTKTKENYTLCDHYNHWPLSVDLTWLLKHKNKRELYTLWSLQPLITICRSNMTVETQKQKENYTLCDHYNHWPLSVDLTWLLKHKNKRELYTLWSLQPLTTICRSNMTLCDHYNHWTITKNKRELYTLWSLQPLTTICRSNMTLETQKQKRIIHFVITTTIDHYLSI